MNREEILKKVKVKENVARRKKEYREYEQRCVRQSVCPCCGGDLTLKTGSGITATWEYLVCKNDDYKVEIQQELDNQIVWRD